MHINRHRGLPEGWVRAWAGLTAVLLPTHCPGCALVDVPICSRCRGLLAGPGLPVAEVTGTRPRAWPAELEGTTTARYEGPVRALVHAWKDRGRHDLTPVMAGALAPQLLTQARLLAPAPLTVVPVPAAPRNIARRGGDLLAEAARLAVQRAARRPGGAGLSLSTVLRRRPGVRDQRGLGAGARARNIRDGLVCRVDLHRRTVVLVDDVLTTGASTAEAARVLGAAGADVLAVVTVAATP